MLTWRWCRAKKTTSCAWVASHAAVSESAHPETSLTHFSPGSVARTSTYQTATDVFVEDDMRQVAKGTILRLHTDLARSISNVSCTVGTSGQTHLDSRSDISISSSLSFSSSLRRMSITVSQIQPPIPNSIAVAFSSLQIHCFSPSVT